MLDLAKLKRLREKAGLSQEQAAIAAGFSGRQHWYSIESGRKSNVSLDTLNKIAKALNVKPRDLLK